MLHHTFLTIFHLAAPVPGNGPSAPPGLGAKAGQLVGWAKYGAGVACLFGVLYSGGKLAHSHKSGYGGGASHEHLWWALGGCALVGAAGALVSTLT